MSIIKVKVNGKLVEAKVEGNMRLLDLVRNTLKLTAKKKVALLVNAVPVR